MDFAEVDIPAMTDSGGMIHHFSDEEASYSDPYRSEEKCDPDIKSEPEGSAEVDNAEEGCHETMYPEVGITYSPEVKVEPEEDVEDESDKDEEMRKQMSDPLYTDNSMNSPSQSGPPFVPLQKKYTRRRKNTNEKPFACTECAYTSKDKSNLKSHYLIHTGVKPYACTECQYTCRRTSHLKRHMFTHTGMKPFACPECNHACSQFSELKVHLLTHTGEKPFACSECPYACRLKADLLRHKLTHTGEKPFQCSECAYNCRLKTHLKRHYMLKHINKSSAVPSMPSNITTSDVYGYDEVD